MRIDRKSITNDGSTNYYSLRANLAASVVIYNRWSTISVIRYKDGSKYVVEFRPDYVHFLKVYDVVCI